MTGPTISDTANGTVRPTVGNFFPDLCVVTAAEVEFNAVARLLDAPVTEYDGRLRLCRGSLNGNQVTVLIAGIGAAGFPERLAARLAAKRYDALIVIGLAGGLDEQLRLGDTVVYDSCLQAGPGMAEAATPSVREKRPAREENASITCDAALSEILAENLRKGGARCHVASGVTTTRLMASAAEKQALWKASGTAVVDMETFQILQVSRRCGLPAAVIRVVSDEAGQDLPDFNPAVKSGGNVSRSRAVLAMLRRPVAAARFLGNLDRVTAALKLAAGDALGAAWRSLD